MKDKIADQAFTDAEEIKLSSKTKLSIELKKLCDSGLAFFYMPEGKCIMRPDIKILGNCTIYAKHIDLRGVVKTYKYVLTEITYEKLSFI